MRPPTHALDIVQETERVQKVRENFVPSYKLLSHGSERLDLKTADCRVLSVESEKGFLNVSCDQQPVL